MVEHGPKGDVIDRAIQAVEARYSAQSVVTSATSEPETTNHLPTMGQRRKASRLSVNTLAGGLGLAFLGGFGNPIPAPTLENPPAIVIEGQMPSLSSSIVVFNNEQALDAVKSPETSKSAIKETAQSAAKRYGADTYSEDWHNWKMTENNTAATLKPDPSGLAHRVRVNGAVIEGWLGVKRPGIDAVPVVVNPRGIQKMDLQGGTFRLFPVSQREEQFNRLVDGTRIKEKNKQPGTDVMPVCVPLQKETRWVNPAKIPSRSYAAKQYGADTYSRNCWRPSWTGSI